MAIIHYMDSAHGAKSAVKQYALLVFVLVLIALFAYVASSFYKALHVDLVMRFFMAGFFLVFSSFKLLDVQGFAQGYRSYDIVAKKSLFYARTYPFIELFLGFAYLINLFPTVINLFTFVLMLISSVGVLETIINKRKVKCACLGNIISLPVSTVTLLEDLLMGAMALYSFTQLFSKL